MHWDATLTETLSNDSSLGIVEGTTTTWGLHVGDIFADVPCPSPFADWIEELFNRGITAGCSSTPMAYCPGSTVNRGQCAVFQSKTFDLELYGP